MSGPLRTKHGWKNAPAASPCETTGRATRSGTQGFDSDQESNANNRREREREGERERERERESERERGYSHNTANQRGRRTDARMTRHQSREREARSVSVGIVCKRSPRRCRTTRRLHPSRDASRKASFPRSVMYVLPHSTDSTDPSFISAVISAVNPILWQANVR